MPKWENKEITIDNKRDSKPEKANSAQPMCFIPDCFIVQGSRRFNARKVISPDFWEVVSEQHHQDSNSKEKKAEDIQVWIEIFCYNNDIKVQEESQQNRLNTLIYGKKLLIFFFSRVEEWCQFHNHN